MEVMKQTTFFQDFSLISNGQSTGCGLRILRFWGIKKGIL